MMFKQMIAGGAAALVAGGIVASVAGAATVPTFKSDLIVPNRSVAGIDLKADHAAAVKAFASGGRSCSVTQCGYTLKDGSSLYVTFVKLTAHGRAIVGQINFGAGASGNGTHTFDSPLDALKTSSGIGLGATTAAVERAYPHARKTRLSSETDFSIVGHGEIGTTFLVDDGRVVQVEMQAVHLG